MRDSTRWLVASSVVGLSFLSYVHFVLTFGVNVPFWDDWELLDLIREINLGQMDWWKLIIVKHNEHLLGFGFLVEAWQLLLTDFDYKLQLLTGALIQGLAFGLLSAAMWRAIPQNRRALWLTMSSFIWFSIAQYKNLLWPFQTAWFLVTLLLAIALTSLHRARQLEEEQGSGWGVWLSISAAAVLLADFTSFQGVIVCFAGTLYLVGCHSFKLEESLRSRLMRNWLISAGIAGILFAYVWLKQGGGLAEGGDRFSLRTFAEIFVGVHGDFWGNLGTGRLYAIGAVMLLFVCLALVQVALSSEKAKYALPVSLIGFGVCFVFFVAVGRAKFGNGPVSDSHYTAYSVLTFFGVLSIFLQRDDTLPNFYPSRWAPVAFSAIILLAGVGSYYDGVLRGIGWRSDQGMGVAVLLKYREEPDFALARLLFGDPAMVRRNAEFLQVHRYGPFGDIKAIPAAVNGYAIMPKSMEDMISKHPGQQEAILRAWKVYQVGSDLRAAFNPFSDQFAHDLLAWCDGATHSTSQHYLAQYLMPFVADYAAIKQAEQSNQSSR